MTPFRPIPQDLEPALYRGPFISERLETNENSKVNTDYERVLFAERFEGVVGPG